MKSRLRTRTQQMAERLATGNYDQLHHLRGDEAWLIGEQRASGEKTFYLPIALPRRICAH